MSFAIIETGGKQYKVSPGDVVIIEKVEKEPGEKLTFDRVLLLAPDRKKVQLGTPYLSKAKVEGKVLEQGKGKKLIVYKKKAKKRYEKKQGHRQPFSKVKITTIK